MSRVRLLVPLLSGLLALPACSSGTDSSGTVSPAPVEPTASVVTEAADPSPFEGTWTTDLTRDAVRAYIRKAGWSRKVEAALMKPDMAAPATTEFRIDFENGYFLMSLAATGEPWQSGTYPPRGRTHVPRRRGPRRRDELRYHLDDSTVTFDDPVDSVDPNNESEWIDGAPVWAAGAVMWASTTWTRADS